MKSVCVRLKQSDTIVRLKENLAKELVKLGVCKFCCKKEWKGQRSK